jgi:hypothetical protein
MTGAVDRSTRQTDIATLDRAAPTGNQRRVERGPPRHPVRPRHAPQRVNRPLSRANTVISQHPRSGAMFPALR